MNKVSEAQGVCRVWSTSIHALGGVLGGLGAHFASFFRFRFLYRFFIVFLSILEGFWEGFGGQNCRKIDIFGDFLDMCYETFIFLKNSLIFSKIADETHIDFDLFLMLFFVFFRTLETLKIVLPSRRELNFCKIAFFALDEKRQRK